MRKTLWACLPLLLLLATVAAAQDAPKKTTTQKTITIKKDGNTETKTIIEIDGDKVIVNGKEFKGGAGSYSDSNQTIIIHGDGFTMRSGGIGPTTLSLASSAFLGVQTTDNAQGAQITKVVEESPAEKAGLKEEDIITKVNGEAIKGQEELASTIRKLKADDKVSITYLRSGKEEKVEATLSRSNFYNFMADEFLWQENPMAMTTPRPRVPRTPAVPRNFEFVPNFNLMLFDRPKYGIDVEDNPDGPGAIVKSVTAGSVADKAGIKENDLITDVAGTPIKNIDVLRNELFKARNDGSIKMTVKQGNRTKTIDVAVPKVIKRDQL